MAGILRYFSDPQNKGSNFQGKFRSNFRETIHASIKNSRANFALQMCHPNILRHQRLRNLGTTPIWKKDALGVKRPFSDTGPKKHINFFNINFLAPTQNTRFWPPRKKLMCLISWERTQKGTHINFFGGDFGVKKGVPNRPFSATKSLVYRFFPALIGAILGIPGYSRSNSRNGSIAEKVSRWRA